MDNSSNDVAYVGAPDTATGMSAMGDVPLHAHHSEAGNEGASFAVLADAGDLERHLAAADTTQAAQSAMAEYAMTASGLHSDEAASPLDPMKLELLQLETSLMLAMIANEYFARTPQRHSTLEAADTSSPPREPVRLGLAGRMSVRSVRVKQRFRIVTTGMDEAVAALIEEAASELPEETMESASDIAATLSAPPEAPPPPRPPLTTNIVAFPLAAKYMR